MRYSVDKVCERLWVEPDSGKEVLRLGHAGGGDHYE